MTPRQWQDVLAALRTQGEAHGHTTIADTGDCPTCRLLEIELHADAPNGWITWYPDSHQLAVVRTWSPIDHESLDTAWATGCNTGGTAGYSQVDVATIEKSGVPTFTLLSGDTATRAAHALGGAPPWEHDIVADCPHCDNPIVVRGDDTPTLFDPNDQP